MGWFLYLPAGRQNFTAVPSRTMRETGMGTAVDKLSAMANDLNLQYHVMLQASLIALANRFHNLPHKFINLLHGSSDVFSGFHDPIKVNGLKGRIRF